MNHYGFLGLLTQSRPCAAYRAADVERDRALRPSVEC